MKKIETQPVLAGSPGKRCPAVKEAINEQPPFYWKSILVPIDLSEPSKEAIRTAVSLAEQYDAKMFLFHVIQLPICCSFDAPPNTDEMMSLARDSLDEIAGTFPPEIVCEKIVRLGTQEPVREILDEARNVSADLIIIGTHGYSGLKRVLLGSTAERVVRHASCPVLVARLKGEVSTQACLHTELRIHSKS